MTIERYGSIFLAVLAQCAKPFASYARLSRQLDDDRKAGRCMMCGDEALPAERFCEHHQLEHSSAP